MPRFPKTENGIIELAGDMALGYYNHPAYYPNANRPELAAALQAAGLATLRLFFARRDAHDATSAKDTALAELVTEMRRQLEQSEVDTFTDEKALEYINWGLRAPSDDITKPAMARNLTATSQVTGGLTLDWQPPATAEGGRPRGYLIYRRERAQDGSFTPWHQAGLALTSKKILTNQPTGIELEYYVLAFNTTGTGTPSNTIMAVL